MTFSSWNLSARFSDLGVGEPRLFTSMVLGLLTAVILCWPTWPGFMSYDTIAALRQSIEGITSGIWPPMQAYLLYLSRLVGLNVVGYFFGQAFLLFFSVFIILGFLTRTKTAHLLAIAAFVAVFLLFPTLWGTLGVIWKDVTTASFACAGVASWMLAIHYRSRPLVVIAGLAFFVSLALRFNAFPLTLAVIAGLAALPLGWKSTRNDRIFSTGIVMFFSILAVLSTTYRLPDLARLPADKGFSGIQLFDMVGISACSGERLAPLTGPGGERISPEQLKEIYDPRHANITLQPHDEIPAALAEKDANAMSALWIAAISSEPACYLEHRANVFSYLLGLNDGPTFYPTHGGIDANSYGFVLANPAAAATWTSAIAARSDQWFARIYLLYIAATTMLIGWIFIARNRSIVLPLLWIGAILYPATLFLVSPAGDARYLFPSSIFCCLVVVGCGASLLEAVLRNRNRSQHMIT